MSFSTILFTEKGRALQAKAMSGATLQFTKLAMGSGSLGGQSPITLTTLIDPKAVLPITSIKRSSNHVTLKGIFKNSDIAIGFYWREIGVYAQDPDLGEILYCYGNAGTLAEYIPPQTSEIIEKSVGLSVIVGSATNVIAIIDESLVFVTKPELEEVREKADAATTIQTAGGTGTAIILNNATLVNGSIITFVVAANNNGAATTINGKSLYKPNTTEPPTLTAGKAVTVWYNGTYFYTINDDDAATVNGYTVESNVPSNAKFTDTVTSINGKTGAISKTDITALGIPAQDTVYTHPATHPPTILASGTLPVGVVATEGTDYTVRRPRNIYAGTVDLTAGSSALANGTFYVVYE